MAEAAELAAAVVIVVEIAAGTSTTGVPVIPAPGTAVTHAFQIGFFPVRVIRSFFVSFFRFSPVSSCSCLRSFFSLLVRTRLFYTRALAHTYTCRRSGERRNANRPHYGKLAVAVRKSRRKDCGTPLLVVKPGGCNAVRLPIKRKKQDGAFVTVSQQAR